VDRLEAHRRFRRGGRIQQIHCRLPDLLHGMRMFGIVPMLLEER